MNRKWFVPFLIVLLLPPYSPPHIPQYCLTEITGASIHLYFYKRVLVQRILSNWHLDLPDCSSAALSSIAVATATTHSSALHLKQSFCINVPET